MIIMLEETDDLIIEPAVAARIPITSFTRLTAFQTCSEFYRLKYLNKTITETIATEALVLGKFVHYILEECLDPATPTTEAIYAFTLGLPEFLNENYLSALAELQEDIVTYVSKGAHLLYRASDRCRVEDYPIRNRDKSIPKNPIEFPPQEFSSEFNKTCAKFKLLLDTAASRSNNLFSSCSLFWLLSKALYWTHYWRPPTSISKTIAVELGFSTTDLNKVAFHNVFMNGYIDWVVQTKDNFLSIIDHKTSKAKPTPQGVLHHPQLNLYAWLYFQTYGRWSDLIGINHLPSGELIQVDLDQDIALNIVGYLKELQLATTKGTYTRRHPTDYNSPCIKRDWKSGEITYLCPALKDCWPDYLDTLSLLS